MSYQAIAQENYSEAVRKASEAFAIQTGIKDHVDRFAKDIERKYVPVIIVNNGSIIVFLVEGLATDQWKIGHKWDF